MEVSDSSQQETFVKPRRLEEESSENKTDLDISEEYKRVCKAIGTWMDAIERDRQPYLRQKLLIRPERPRDYGDLIPLGLCQNRQDGWMTWLAQHNTSNCVVVSLIIWRFLKEEIFDKFFPIGIEDEKRILQRFIEDIVKVMKAKDQTRGPVSRAGTWRSETMNAMVATTGFRERRDDISEALFDSLVRKLTPWVRRETLSRHQEMLKSKVFVLALTLHQDMKCSRQDYEMRPAKVTRGTKPEIAQSWTLRNLRTWISTKYSTIDGVFHPLFPGLYRTATSKEDDLELVKPVVIAYQDEQGQIGAWSTKHQETQLNSSEGYPRPSRAQSASLDPSSLPRLQTDATGRHERRSPKRSEWVRPKSRHQRRPKSTTSHHARENSPPRLSPVETPSDASKQGQRMVTREDETESSDDYEPGSDSVPPSPQDSRRPGSSPQGRRS